MWALLKSLLAKWAIVRLLLKSLGSLAWLLPLAFILKAFGLPLLIVLGVLALPLLLVLLVLGLPLLLVVAAGGFLLTITMWLVGMGLMVLKIALPIILVLWCIRWLMSRNSATPDTPAVPDVPDIPGTADAT